MTDAQSKTKTLSDFITRWEASGAAERANYQLFLCELCDILGVPRPEPAKADSSHNSYVFEHPVLFDDGLGHTTTKFVDLYKKGFFILEAKQGSDKTAEAESSGLKLPKKGRRGTAIRGTQGWDDAMLAARGQAELYAKALPTNEGWPPFLVIVDVGHSIELYADFSRSGKTYVAFPDALTHRIPLGDVAKDDIQERLRSVWTDPLSLDPSKKSAKVTREVAEKLADLAKSLERSGHLPEVVAHFLMRSIFTMFAEDVGLLPKDSFKTLLEGRRGKLETFPDMVGSLWIAMDRGEFSPILERKLLRFNGQLFTDPHALPITGAQLELLIEAAKADWKSVEPAIFGTLLERALDPVERHKLGAHYTPRAYVERLVIPTIVEPLREDWSAVQAAAVTLAKANKLEEAREEVRAFLKKLCAITVLDPACGSGNFLYVTLEHMKRLEGEVRDALRGFGERQEVFEGVGLTVDPHQLLGIELNPRAAAIAELVLWIGYLQWHFRTFGAKMPAEPVIKVFRNIEHRDAVLAFERQEVMYDADGQPITRWDGQTTKKHPVTGKETPDESARIPVYNYIKPKQAEWPCANFIVGNPPFVGNKVMREALGDGYVEALRGAFPDVPDSVDYVMYWWHQAASKLDRREVASFGFITRNSITQKFNRRVVADHLGRSDPFNIRLAIPNHPWVDSADGAQVRIAMTVCGHDLNKSGRLLTVIDEVSQDGGEITVEFLESEGYIQPDLSIGPNVLNMVALKANQGLACPGVQLSGQGFVLEPDDLKRFSASTRTALIKRYITGYDLMQRSREQYLIDTADLNHDTLRDDYADAYHHISDFVKDRRKAKASKTKDSQDYAARWWRLSKPRTEFRKSLVGLDRFVVSSRTSRHRVFQFLGPNFLPETKVLIVALRESWQLGVLSSQVHVAYATRRGGWHGVGNDPTYNHTECFDPFPFPDCSSEHKRHIGLLADRIDQHRKRQLADYPDLSLTNVYNVLEKLRSGEPLSEKEQVVHEQGLISVLKQLHDDLDSAVFAAYSWPGSLSVQEILARLVALNAERATDEAQGIIRWLRPEFQNPTGHRAATQTNLIDEPEGESVAAPAKMAKTPWPKTLPERAQAVRTALAAQRTPVTPEQLAKTFFRANVDKVEELLDTLTSLGQARELSDGRFVSPLILSKSIQLDG
jgi:hypothetical protein